MSRTKLRDSHIPVRDTVNGNVYNSRAERRETRIAVDRKMARRSTTARQNKLANAWLNRNHPDSTWESLRKS